MTEQLSFNSFASILAIYLLLTFWLVVVLAISDNVRMSRYVRCVELQIELAKNEIGNVN